MVRENRPVLTLGAQYAAEIPEMQDIPCALLEPLPEPLFSARTLYPSEGYHLFAFATLNSSFKTEFITLDSNSRAQYEQQPVQLRESEYIVKCDKNASTSIPPSPNFAVIEKDTGNELETFSISFHTKISNGHSSIRLRHTVETSPC